MKFKLLALATFTLATTLTYAKEIRCKNVYDQVLDSQEISKLNALPDAANMSEEQFELAWATTGVKSIDLNGVNVAKKVPYSNYGLDVNIFHDEDPFLKDEHIRINSELGSFRATLDKNCQMDMIQFYLPKLQITKTMRSHLHCIQLRDALEDGDLKNKFARICKGIADNRWLPTLDDTPIQMPPAYLQKKVTPQ